MSPRWPIFSTSLLSMTCKLLPPHHVGQQRHLPGALYRRCGLALVLRTQTRYPAGPHLSAVRDEPPQQVVVLVVHVGTFSLQKTQGLLLVGRPPRGGPFLLLPILYLRN